MEKQEISTICSASAHLMAFALLRYCEKLNSTPLHVEIIVPTPKIKPKIELLDVSINVVMNILNAPA